FGLGPTFARAGRGDYVQFLTPGIVTMGILFAAVFSGIGIIWDRHFGFLKETLVAPVSRLEIVLGQRKDVSVQPSPYQDRPLLDQGTGVENDPQLRGPRQRWLRNAAPGPPRNLPRQRAPSCTAASSSLHLHRLPRSSRDWVAPSESAAVTETPGRVSMPSMEALGGGLSWGASLVRW
ncbi:MAG TPA: hypothetical protein VGG62_13230, partial [Terracidiphilus sp.]